MPTLNQFDLLAWLRRSTTASSVPLKVTNKLVLHELAVRLRLLKGRS